MVQVTVITARRCPPLIRSQLGECAKYITYSDFPEQWPGLLPSVLASLGSGEQPRVSFAALESSAAWFLCIDWAITAGSVVRPSLVPAAARAAIPCAVIWSGRRQQPSSCSDCVRRTRRDRLCAHLSYRSLLLIVSTKWAGRLQPQLNSHVVKPPLPLAQVWGALYVLRVLTRKYEFKDEEDRAPLAPVVNAAFPPLLAMLQVRPDATSILLLNSVPPSPELCC